VNNYKHIEVSIIIAAYNAQKFISRAIGSCLNQSMDHSYEIIVIDDGSEDDTCSVASTFNDVDFVQVHRIDQNIGLPAVCNVGIKEAKGVYVVRVDADDFIHRDMIKIMHTYMLLRRAEVDAVSCNYYRVDDKGSIIHEVPADVVPIACGIMFKKDCLIDIGLYDEDFLLNEDKDLRIRFEEKYKIMNIPLPLYKYRMHKYSMTQNSDMIKQYDTKLEEKHGRT